jgi:hypothetical protein
LLVSLLFGHGEDLAKENDGDVRGLG